MTKEEIDASLKKTLGFDPGDNIFKEDNDQLDKILADTSEAISAMNLSTVEEKQKVCDMINVAKKANTEYLDNPTDSSAEFARRAIVSAQTTLSSISEQTALMSETVNHIYKIITTSGIVDPDLVSSFAVLVSSAKDLWAMKLDVYKMLLGQIQAVNMENLKQMHRIELEREKFELKKKLAESSKATPIDAGSKTFVFDNTQILKKISAAKRGQVEEVVDVEVKEPNAECEHEAMTEPSDLDDDDLNPSKD